MGHHVTKKCVRLDTMVQASSDCTSRHEMYPSGHHASKTLPIGDHVYYFVQPWQLDPRPYRPPRGAGRDNRHSSQLILLPPLQHAPCPTRTYYCPSTTCVPITVRYQRVREFHMMDPPVPSRRLGAATPLYSTYFEFVNRHNTKLTF